MIEIAFAITDFSRTVFTRQTLPSPVSTKNTKEGPVFSFEDRAFLLTMKLNYDISC